MSKKKKREPKPRSQQEYARPASTDLVVYTPTDANRPPVVQAILGEGRLPPFTEESLLEAYRYLAAQLSFPFDATYDVDTDFDHEEKVSSVTVFGLIEPDDQIVEEGLLCKALEDGEAIELPLYAVDVSPDSKNRKLIEGYLDWYFNSEREEVNEVTFLDRVQMNSFNLRSSPLPFWKAAFFSIFACGIFGFVLGAVTGSMEIARISALVGAAIIGFLGGFLGSRVGRGIAIVSGWKPGGFAGAAFGIFAGGVVGAVTGAALVAFVGILGGAVVGFILGAMINRPALGLLAGLLLGPVALALYLDNENALLWAMHGAWIGALAAVMLLALSKLFKRELLRTKNKAATSGTR
jgi:hypothetical protein